MLMVITSDLVLHGTGDGTRMRPVCSCSRGCMAAPINPLGAPARRPALIAQGRISRRRRSPVAAHARAERRAYAPDPIPTMCAIVTMPGTIQPRNVIATRKAP
ncbi:hypothetical protein AA0616_1121 [Komagataeibacter nataicola NRIC 0616]|nr:hypothetical protein AA0616_1121 [Komagataeibacter nataicola NRIC 0616]